MNKRYCIFFDIDGTLTLCGNLPEENRQALIKAQKAGHLLFINTGRGQAFIPIAVAQAIDWDGVVAGSAFARLKDKVLLNAHIGKQQLLKACTYCGENNIACLFEGVDEIYSVGHKFAVEITYPYEKFLDQNYDKMNITKITFSRSLSNEELELFSEFKLINMPTYAEAIIDGYDKSSGMKAIIEELGMTREDTIAFGDSKNDIEMLKFAGTSVIMNHASPEMDQYATIRTKTDFGPAEGLELLGII